MINELMFYYSAYGFCRLPVRLLAFATTLTAIELSRDLGDADAMFHDSGAFVSSPPIYLPRPPLYATSSRALCDLGAAEALLCFESSYASLAGNYYSISLIYRFAAFS